MFSGLCTGDGTQTGGIREGLRCLPLGTAGEAIEATGNHGSMTGRTGGGDGHAKVPCPRAAATIDVIGAIPVKCS